MHGQQRRASTQQDRGVVDVARHVGHVTLMPPGLEHGTDAGQHAPVEVRGHEQLNVEPVGQGGPDLGEDPLHAEVARKGSALQLDDPHAWPASHVGPPRRAP